MYMHYVSLFSARPSEVTHSSSSSDFVKSRKYYETTERESYDSASTALVTFLRFPFVINEEIPGSAVVWITGRDVDC